MGKNKLWIVITVIIVIIIVIMAFLYNYSISEILAVYHIKTKSKKIQLINPIFINKIVSMTIDDKEVDPCYEFYFEKGYHYVTFKIIKTNTTNSMFSLITDLEEIILERFDTSSVTDMKDMFFGCSSLDDVRMRNLKLNNVKNMECFLIVCL